jgi:hypothetical protein
VPSPQAVVMFVAILFLMLVALHVPIGLPAIPSAAAAFLLALGAGWIVNRRVPDDDEDITEDARNGEPTGGTDRVEGQARIEGDTDGPASSEEPHAEHEASANY